MEIFGGLVIMVSMLGLLLTVVWLAVPFMLLVLKGKVERNSALLESIDRRLAAMEEKIRGTDR